MMTMQVLNRPPCSFLYWVFQSSPMPSTTGFMGTNGCPSCSMSRSFAERNGMT